MPVTGGAQEGRVLEGIGPLPSVPLWAGGDKWRISCRGRERGSDSPNAAKRGSRRGSRGRSPLAPGWTRARSWGPGPAGPGTSGASGACLAWEVVTRRDPRVGFFLELPTDPSRDPEEKSVSRRVGAREGPGGGRSRTGAAWPAGPPPRPAPGFPRAAGQGQARRLVAPTVRPSAGKEGRGDRARFPAPARADSFPRGPPSARRCPESPAPAPADAAANRSPLPACPPAARTLGATRWPLKRGCPLELRAGRYPRGWRRVGSPGIPRSGRGREGGCTPIPTRAPPSLLGSWRGGLGLHPPSLWLSLERDLLHSAVGVLGCGVSRLPRSPHRVPLGPGIPLWPLASPPLRGAARTQRPGAGFLAACRVGSVASFCSPSTPHLSGI